MVSAVSRPYWTMMLFASSSTWNAISSIVSSAYSPPSSVCSFLKHSRITLTRPVKLSLSMYNSTSRDGETQARVSFRTSKSIRSMPTLTNGNQQKLKSKKRKLNRNLSTEKIVIEAFENEKEVDDQGSSLMIPSEIKNDESSLQSKYLKHLDRHLVLVLNADYQVRICLLNQECNRFAIKNLTVTSFTFCLLMFSIIAAAQSCTVESLDMARCSQGDSELHFYSTEYDSLIV